MSDMDKSQEPFRGSKDQRSSQEGSLAGVTTGNLLEDIDRSFCWERDPGKCPECGKTGVVRDEVSIIWCPCGWTVYLDLVSGN